MLNFSNSNQIRVVLWLFHTAGNLCKHSANILDNKDSFVSNSETERASSSFYIYKRTFARRFIVTVFLSSFLMVEHLYQWVRLAKQETLTPPGHLACPLVCRGPWMSTVMLYCWCHSDSASVLLYFTFCHTCSLCRVELVVQFPAKGLTQVLLCLFSGVWLWHFLYSVDPHPVSSLHIYTSVVSRAFMAGAASQAGDADSSRAPGPTSGLQGSVNVYRGALLLVTQWHCISSFVFLHVQRLNWHS